MTNETADSESQSRKIWKPILIVMASLLCIIIGIFVIPEIATMDKAEKRSLLMSNMHNVQMAAEEFAVENSMGLFPADTVTQTNDIDPKSKFKNTFLLLLHQQLSGFNKVYENPYSKQITPLIIVLDSASIDLKAQPGQVIYNPIRIVSKGAKGYRIFGKDNRNIISLVLTNDTTVTAYNK